MTVIGYITFLLLALFSVFLLRGGLEYVFPTIHMFLRQIFYNLETLYNQYNGYAQPVDPDPSTQFVN